jgi:NADH:ubiquinone oxidoreductase subunit H
LMYIGWKSFLPLSLGYLLLSVGILISFNWLPT